MNALSLRTLFSRSLILTLILLTMAVARADMDRNIEEMIEDVVRTAESYLGTPHRMGGTTKRGIDCSGLMVKSFESVGILLPRTSVEQARIGDKVRTSQLERGDLVFFNINGRISHVGLVTQSDRNDTWFIHTSSSRGVIVSRLSETYWTKHASHGRRVWSVPAIARTQPGSTTQAVVPGSYPEASLRKLKRREIKRMSARKAQIVQAEIWARNGYRFRDNRLQRQFEREPWYRQMDTSKRKWKAKRSMSDIEKKNLRRLRRIADLEKVE